MLISGSILAVKNGFFDYAKVLKQSGVDYLHIDLFGNDSGEFKFCDILRFDNSYLPLDIHLIYPNITEEMITTLNSSTAHMLSLQYEALDDPITALETARHFKGNVGLAVTPSTAINDITTYLDFIQHLLVMCSEPGVSGAKFQTSSYNMLDLLYEKYPTLNLYADGGIESGIAKKMSAHKVKMVVSGSFLAKNAANIDSTVFALKYGGERDIPISRLLIKPFALPVVGAGAELFDVMDTINRGRLGVCFVADNGKLKGVISDGDIRRAYLKLGRGFFDITASQVMNRDCFTTDLRLTLEELYQKISDTGRPITVIPVVNNGEFEGAISLR
ncbi:MAG: CBS domain-containing protein [Treponema sp.]|jgi:pentose-5-phosphate-3-epimerase|nr:CBS domain-containing protein [Treponema sp.]